MKAELAYRFPGLTFLTGFLLMGLMSIGCAPTNTVVEGGLRDRDPQLAYRLVIQEGALLLDVRSPREFAAGHLTGARNLHIDELPHRMGEVATLVGESRDRAIVVYCTAGVRAAQAKRLLLGEGYTRVTNLGGMLDWPGQ